MHTKELFYNQKMRAYILLSL